MTDERMKPDSDNATDPLVSATYRENATERAPEHLDAAVLKMAADAARPKYSIMRTWTRPVAWAAVVMLSFGLVLELTQTPEPPARDQAPAPATIAEPAAEERLLLEEDVQMEFAAGAAKRERDREDAQELKATDTDMFDRAEEMARMQQGPSDAPVQPASAQPVIAEEVAADAAIPLSEKNAMRSTAQFAVAPAVCDEEARGEAETWLDCIEEFEEAGMIEAAAAERQLFDAAFPNYDR